MKGLTGEPVKLDVDIMVIAVVAPFGPPLMRKGPACGAA